MPHIPDDPTKAQLWIEGESPNQTVSLYVPPGKNGPPGIVTLTHGTDANAARPVGPAVVYWIGTVLPNNAIATDLWYEG